MSKFPIQKALKYYWDSKTIYSAHSPFIFRFMQEVMQTNVENKPFTSIESKRKELLRSKSSIPFVEFGAGSRSGSNASQRKIADVARNSLSGQWQCSIMYNLIDAYNLKNRVEIGTSLGISTAYLASTNSVGKVLTFEGNPSSADVAKSIWKDLNLVNVDVRIGEFSDTLQHGIHDFETIDFAFLDGNHRKQATIDYFNLLKPKSAAHSIFIVDDIYWSEGMHEAWEAIKADSDVAFSIDLFRMGIVFFDHSIMPKQHFKLIQYKYKPWSFGLFG